MIDNQELLKRIKELDPYMRETRGYLHQHPEVSSEEWETRKFLQAEVAKLDLPITDVPRTGFYVTLDTGRPGRTVALRADIDALPIQKQPNNLKGPRKWVSKKDGVSHMCGHDGHMAVLLAAMELLYDLREKLSGKIIFLFEEGEEVGSGIAAMLEAIEPLGIEAIYGTHLTAFMPTGQICLDGGPRMAGAAVIDLEVVGQSGHGSRPDLSINPVFAGANVLTGLSSAWANQIDVSKTVTLGLTQFHAGAINNIIPETAFIGGSLRYFDVAEGLKAVETLKKVAEKTAEAHNCQIRYLDTMRIATIPVINDDNLAELAQLGAENLFPGSVVEGVQWYASESFSHYAKVAPSVFAFVGMGNEAVGSGAEHHNDYFDLDEDALSYSLGATVKFAINFLM
ncbi:amidohydrolase [Vagococcus sp. BWB3-3]|uniref:Amidohydrolase n=1 Tax=Vagococcus allomyrinae TaxID=2794353 RepID=A0A940SW19_9ENTE|nr:amidohydrolase [Vagococcus allomyrinae]MBP1042870.1 amidohydrolase [Vagococcus allomyrinae]